LNRQVNGANPRHSRAWGEDVGRFTFALCCAVFVYGS